MTNTKVGLMANIFLYCAISILVVTLEFIITSLFIRGAFFGFKYVYGVHFAYKMKFIIYDFIGFALLTVLNAVAQYYLATLLSINMRNRKNRYMAIAASTLIASPFFIQLSMKTGFDSCIMASLPLIISYFIGGFFGISEDKSRNPWKNTNIRIFN